MAESAPKQKEKKFLHTFLELMEDLWLVLIIVIATATLIIWLSFKIPTTSIIGLALYYLLIFSPVWLSFLLIIVAWDLWLIYIRSLSVSKIKPVLLEIKLPKEVRRSPMAMEVFFSALYFTGSSSFLEQYWHGKIRPWFSLELVSLGGAVHFYIWTDDKNRAIVEAQLYAQYPEAVIQEVDDYTKNVTWDPTKWGLWGTYFRLGELDAYPIKTYVDYGLDKPSAEEEEKVDPLTSMLEYLGSLKPHEQAWVQILIQAHKKEGLKEGRLFERPDWKKAARAEIEKIRAEATPKADPKKPDQFKFPNPTKGQVEKIAAIERSISKYPFETVIRCMYVAKDNQFGASSIPGLIGSIRQYNSRELNGFSLGWLTDHGDTAKDLVTDPD
jgi:hypothetical protein